MKKGLVQTALDAAPPSELGVTLPYECVLVDMTLGACSAHLPINITEPVKKAASLPAAGWHAGADGPAVSVTWGAKWGPPICLANRSDVARDWLYFGNYRINDTDERSIEKVLYRNSQQILAVV